MEENPMEVQTFCVDLRSEMTEWKAKTYDLIRELDRRSPSDKARASASIDDLGQMIDEIEKRIDRLEDQCPANWDSERVELGEMVAELEEKWGETAAMSPDDF
jgi:Tfp pilus assembly protein PilO